MVRHHLLTIVRPAALAVAPGVAAAAVCVIATAASAQAASATAPAQVTITASFSQNPVPYFTNDTLSGTVTYQSGGATQPLAGVQLSVGATDAQAGTAPVTVTTGADGSYSYTALIPAGGQLRGVETWTVSFAGNADYGPAQGSASVDYQGPDGFTRVKWLLDPHDVVRVNACLFAGAMLINFYPLSGPITYQYSASATGPWTTLVTPKAVSGGHCAGSDLAPPRNWSFPARLTAPLTNGYYRAFFAGDATDEPAVSSVVHLWRDRTRITRFAINPRTVRTGGKVIVSGRLWVRTTKWIADAHQKIVIEYLYKGKTYILRHRPTTSATGRFRGRFRVPHSARWLAVFDGAEAKAPAAHPAPAQFPTATTPIHISVR
ncbi:MAG TPA: carboxypeptidase-like regulatory domain-containing protein [Streptosporangiaceae bacterium]|jgi:hypothetical protein